VKRQSLIGVRRGGRPASAWPYERLNRGGVFLALRDFESFDLLFDFVGESRRAGAVYNPVIKCE
jgi:hypothetical protein